MVGRGNRAQGTAFGQVFITVKNALRKESNMDFVERRDKMRNDDYGPYIAEAVVKEFESAN